MVSNGAPGVREYGMHLLMGAAHRVRDARDSRPLDAFRGQTVHAVAGIGNPERFFRQLEKRGLSIIRHAFADHHPYTAADLAFEDQFPVLMTEKDAVKCILFATEQHWYVPVDAQVDERLLPSLLRMIRKNHG